MRHIEELNSTDKKNKSKQKKANEYQNFDNGKSMHTVIHTRAMLFSNRVNRIAKRQQTFPDKEEKINEIKQNGVS